MSKPWGTEPTPLTGRSLIHFGCEYYAYVDVAIASNLERRMREAEWLLLGPEKHDPESAKAHAKAVRAHLAAGREEDGR